MINRYALLALALAACGEGRVPRPTLDTLPPEADSLQVSETPMDMVNERGVMSASVGDSSVYTINYSLTKPLRTAANGGPDTVRVNFKRDSAAGVSFVNLTRLKLVQRDTAAFKVDKVYGRLATYRACVSIRKTVTIGVSKCSVFTTTLPAKADTTPPAVDSVRVDSSLAIAGILVKPDTAAITLAQWKAVGVYFQDPLTKEFYGKDSLKLSWTCPAGGPGKCPQIRWCAYVRLLSGAVGMTQNSWDVPECQRRFDSLPGHLPTYTPVRFRTGGHPLPDIKIAIDEIGGGQLAITSVAFNGLQLARANGQWVAPGLAPVGYILEAR